MLDEVTRFFQRRHFDEQLEARLLQAEREKRRLAVLLVDADGIARVNERWGRATGDAVMVGFGRRIAASLSPDDVFAHHDGNRLASSGGRRPPIARRPSPSTWRAGSPGRRSRSRAVATPPS